MESGSQHISRHFVALQATHVAWLPSPPPGPPDTDGVTTHYKLFALAAWSEDVQEHHLSIMALEIRAGGGFSSGGGGSDLEVSTQRLASWRHPGPATALQVARSGSSGGDVAVFSGSSGGAVCRLQLSVPVAPGATPQDVQLHGGGYEDEDLTPWARLHSGPVAALAVQPDTGELLTAGADGRLFLLPALGGPPRNQPQPFASLGRAVSFRAAAWSSPQTFVTASTTGGLEVWDRQSGAAPLARSPPAWSAQQGRILSVAVHPAQPTLAATGDEDGGIALWDLRFGSPPRRCPPADAAAGAVRQVTLGADGVSGALGGSAADAGPRIVFCTQGGVLASASLRDGKELAAEVLHREECATVTAFDIEESGSGGSGHILAATDQECLVYYAPLGF